MTQLKNEEICINGYFAKFLLAISLLIFTCFVSYHVVHLDTWLDEVKYMAKGFWYVTGRVQPYGEVDGSRYMPIAFLLPGHLEKIFGEGFLTLRSSAAALGVVAILMLYQVTKIALKSTGLAVIAVLLFVCTPIVYLCFATLVIYPLLSILTLAALYVLVRYQNRAVASAVILTLVFSMMFFTRINMIVGIGLMWGWCFFRFKGWRRIFVPLTSAVGFACIYRWTLLQYPEKLAYYAGELPFVKGLIRSMHLSPDLFPLAEQYSSPTEFFHWAWDQQHIDRALAAFKNSYLFAYFPHFLLCSFAAIDALRRRCWRQENFGLEPGLFCALYFLVMSATHFVGSQTYCPSCILTYGGFFFVMGTIGSAFGIGKFISFLRNVPHRFQFFGASVAIVALVFSFTAILPSHTIMLMDKLPPVYTQIEPLTAWLKEKLPPSTNILMLNPSATTTASVFLAGHLPEITSINQPYSLALVQDEGLSPENKKELQRQIRGMDGWTEEMMIEWLNGKYEWVLMDGYPVMTKDILATLSKNFNNYEKFSDVNPEKHLSLWKRKDGLQPLPASPE